MKIIDKTKPWKQQFFECKDLESRATGRQVLELAKHEVIDVKEKKNATAHRRKSHRAK